MLNKAFAGFVVVFWAAMMAALVRVEIFPKPTILDAYPTERVLRKIFANPTPARLNIYRRGDYLEPIGSCRIEIRPRRTGELAEELLPGQQPDAYEVTSDLNMRMSVFGMPSRIRVRGKSTFNQNLDLKNFAMTTRIGARQRPRGSEDARDSDGRSRMSGGFGEIRVTGDDVTKIVTVVLDFGDVHDERVFDFNQVQGAGFASAFGLPGLANFNFAGSSGSTGSSRSPQQSVTTTHSDRLDIAGSRQRVYLISWKISDQMWTKVWVSEADGEVLKVSTSLGLEMVSEIIKGTVDP
jgi:hypothetical protein